ncbi:Photosystem I P700 chlorophyll a apoprotein A2, partial [Mucuna pruriens]
MAAWFIIMVQIAQIDVFFICGRERPHTCGTSLFLTIGSGDFLVHHAITLGLHTTAFILVKGALDAHSSKLMPNKKDFSYSFSYNDLERGGTCDISACDMFYLPVFWMLNTSG